MQVCPTGALKIVRCDDGTMKQEVENQKLQVLFSELGTRPRVYYKNLHRFDRCFIAGSVAVKTGDLLDCAHGATITLTKNDTVVATMAADHFGDYKFDDLKPDSGEYRLEVAYKDFEKLSTPIDLGTSVSLEDIVFG